MPPPSSSESWTLKELLHALSIRLHALRVGTKSGSEESDSESEVEFESESSDELVLDEGVESRVEVELGVEDWRAQVAGVSPAARRRGMISLMSSRGMHWLRLRMGPQR